MRLSLLLGGLVLAACPPSASPPEPRSSLRVSLPDGWRAVPTAKGLEVGPAGRVVLQLETNTRRIPSSAELLAALTTEHVSVLQKESDDTFVGFRYALEVDGGSGEGFVGAKRVGKRTVWCATATQATPAEVARAMWVCQALSWEAAD